MPYDHLITGLPFIKVEAVTHGYPISVQCRVDHAAVCPRCGGHRNKLIKKLYEAARQTLVCEKIRIDREEETQYGTEKYNFRSLLGDT